MEIELYVLPFKTILKEYVLIPERIIYTDESDHAGAGYCLQILGKIVHRRWTEEDSRRSSTWRELIAMELIPDAFKVKLQGKCVKVYTDNQNAARIIEVGSMNKELCDIAFAIVKLCILYRITLNVCWLPRNENIVADFFSDEDDWEIDQRIFTFFNRMWGPFTCDLFANNHNHQVKKFYSKFVDSFTAGVDAFSFDWSQDNNWIVPPVRLISKTISHLMACKGKGVLVAPKWISSPFWSSIVDNNGCFKSFVKDYVEYKNPSRIFVRGSQRNSIFHEEKVSFSVVVLRIEAN